MILLIFIFSALFSRISFET